MNKRGQGMSVNTIILAILAVIVLVVLVLGFLLGWDKVLPWVSKSNVDNIVNSCETACSINSFYEFCTAEKQLKDDQKNKYITSCSVFSKLEEFTKYNIKECSIDCAKPCNEISINKLKGTKDAGVEGYDVGVLANDLTSGEKCVVPFKA